MGKEELIEDLEECRKLRRKSMLNQVNTVIDDIEQGNYNLEEEDE